MSSSSYARISHKKVRSRRYISSSSSSSSSSSNKKNKKTLRYAKAKGYHRNKKEKNGRRSVKHGGGEGENVNDAKRRRSSTNYHELCNNSTKVIDWIHEAPNNGCNDEVKPIKLGVDTIIDRFGPPSGSYFSPFKNNETPYSYMSRSLPYITNVVYCVREYNEVYDMPKHIYHVYIVLKEFTVNSCTASKAFNAPGGAIQYIAVDETKTNNPTTMTIEQLINGGFIRELTDAEYTNKKIKLPPFSLDDE